MMKNRNISRMIVFLLVLAMLLPSVSMTVFSADTPCAEDGCSGKYRNGICSVAGHFEAAPEEGGVYQICNAGQLYWFAALVNSGENEYESDNGDVYNAVLTADIILDGELAWTPIGLYTSGREYIRYSGTFDGAGYTIYGLTYDNTNYDGRNAGFIGTLDEDGVVKNLTLAESTINGATDIGGIVSHNYGTVIGCTMSGSVSGTGAVGGIVCRNMGVVQDCANTGAVTGATTGGIAAENVGEIVACVNSGVVSGTSSVGGIVGMNSGAVEDSMNTANVTAANTHAGGVVGNHIGGEIVGSGNSGAVTGGSDYIGGVAGACLGAAITESWNEGTVTGAANSEAVGGVVGAIDGTNLDKSVITSCFNTGKVNGRSWVGGIAGISGYQETPETVEFSNGYNTGAVTGTSYTGAVVGTLSKGTVSGFYYLSDSAQNTVSGAAAAIAAQFASGEIAVALNEASNVWYQTLDLPGAEPDASPVLDSAHGAVYYGYCNCTEQGYTNRADYDVPGDHVDGDGDLVCDKCGETLSEVHEHSFGDWNVTTEATCTEAGEETRSCECGEIETRVIEALGHDFVNGECTRCDAVKESVFVDVYAGEFFYDPVEWAAEEGVTTGVDPTHFAPYADCTRGQVVTFLWRAVGSPEPETTSTHFVDVHEGDFFYEAVLWAYENGITTGVNDTNFDPDVPCTRAQVVTFLYRTMDEPGYTIAESVFNDVTDPEAYYYDAVLWAYENDITTGVNNNTFGVDEICTRGQTVTFLYRTLK